MLIDPEMMIKMAVADRMSRKLGKIVLNNGKLKVLKKVFNMETKKYLFK